MWIHNTSPPISIRRGPLFPHYVLPFLIYYYDPPPISIGHQFLLDVNFYWTQPLIFLITFFYYCVPAPIPIGRQYLLDASFYWAPISIRCQFLLDASFYWAPVSIGRSPLFLSLPLRYYTTCR